MLRPRTAHLGEQGRSAIAGRGDLADELFVDEAVLGGLELPLDVPLERQKNRPMPRLPTSSMPRS